MSTLSERLDPRIAYGIGPSEGALSSPRIDAPAHSGVLALPDNPATATTMLLSVIGDPTDDTLMRSRFERIFDFAPITAATMQSLVFVGGDLAARRQALRALAARLRRQGRETRLLALEPLTGRDDGPSAREGAGFTSVSSAAALLRLLRENTGETLDLIDSTMPLDCDGSVGTLAHLMREVHAEIILFANDHRIAPAAVTEPLRISRFVLGCRIDARNIETVLELGYSRAWAFAGISGRPGVFHDIEAHDLAERVSTALLSGGFGLPVVETPRHSLRELSGPPPLGSAAR